MGLQMAARVAAIVVIAACSPTPSPPPVASRDLTTDAPSSSLPPATPTPSQAAAEERFPDGIPTTIDDRPVLRGEAALAFADGQADATSFLVAGWVTYQSGIRYCPMIPADEAQSWTRDCGRAQFADVAGTVDPAMTNAVSFRYVLDGLATGPVIAEVQVHDPRAAECGAASVACDAMMVVQRMVWTGDDATAPAPLTADAVAKVLVAEQGSRDMRAWGDDSVFVGCGEAFPSSQVFTVASGDALKPGVTIVLLEPSIDAMRRAAPDRAIACESHAFLHGLETDATDYRWLVVANAALLVRSHGEPTPDDRAFIDGLGLKLGQLAANE